MKAGPRQWFALVLLCIFVYIIGALLPHFVRNLRLQRFVENLTQSAELGTQSNESIRAQVVERARQLGLPVQADHVQVETSDRSVRISVRYVVRVDLPAYTVKLHFAPGAGL